MALLLARHVSCLYHIIHMDETPCLLSISVYCDIVVLKCLADEDWNHAAVLRVVLSRAEGIEISKD